MQTLVDMHVYFEHVAGDVRRHLIPIENNDLFTALNGTQADISPSPDGFPKGHTTFGTTTRRKLCRDPVKPLSSVTSVKDHARRQVIR